MKKEKQKEVEYAFWGYDLFPYVLWGKIVEKLDSGEVRIKEYGDGIVRPLKIFTEKDALVLIDSLTKVKIQRSELTNAINNLTGDVLKSFASWAISK